jgi:hypothetical protein
MIYRAIDAYRNKIENKIHYFYYESNKLYSKFLRYILMNIMNSYFKL